jgi:hypothetical protein
MTSTYLHLKVLLLPPAGLLKSALESFEYDQMESEDAAIYGNRRGIDLAKRQEKMCKDINTLKERADEKIAALKDSNARLADSNARLTQDIEVLRQASLGYRLICHRFIDTYKRDHLVLHSRDVRASIRAGNKVAHEADTVTGASLYTNEGAK